MTRQILCLLAVCVSALPVEAQTFTVSQPSGSTNLPAADDFATRVFQDPWDMSQRTDVGWWTFGKDTAAGHNYLNPTVANGVFTGKMDGVATATLFLLESGLEPSAGHPATPIGKTGQQYPIDANTYTHLVYRMNSDIAGVSQYVWSRGTIYDGQTVAGEIAQDKTVVRTGWKIYDVDLTQLSTLGGSGTLIPWGGSIGALQFLANAASNSATIQIDWARLVHDDKSLKQTIQWSGGNADIYLDNDSDPTNGTLGRIAVNATSPYTFFARALPAGKYFVAVHAPTTGEVPGSAGNFFYSPGSWTINDIPTLQWTTPSDEGSSDDFATTKLGNAWNFTSMADIDSTLPGFPGKVNVVNDGITSLVLTNEAGVNLGPQTVYLGQSVAACPGQPPPCQAANPNDPSGDPQIFTMFWDGKGKTTHIDPTHYRILTIDAGLPNLQRSLPGGSIARVIWRAVNEPTTGADGLKSQTVGQAWEFNSAVGENTMAHITIDMNKMPLADGANGVSTWPSSFAAGGLDAFRWDPHEFAPATNFFVKRIKLAALERSRNQQFTFKWNLSKAATVTIFFDNDPQHTFTMGTQACTVAAPAGPGSCTWSINGTGTPDGEYQIYAKIDDGTNQNFVYAPTNLIVDQFNNGAQIILNRTQLNYAVIGGNRTGPQTVRLSFSGNGSQCWTAMPSVAGLLTISPTSGTGAAAISISATGNFATATTSIAVVFQTCSSSFNTQALDVVVTNTSTPSGPSGSFDTPVDGSTVAGSVPVTGWAAADVQVTSVQICRDPVGGEGTSPSLCGGQNQVFIGNGTFSDDARPDIQAAFPNAPFNYRTGWGYLMLTNFLPNGGNGTFRLWAYAIDADGRTAVLGSKTITGVNSTATKPFGAIDTPGQGATVCGTFINFGWALTQKPKDILPDSSTIGVFIDNVFVGHPGTRDPRPDITAAFPTYDTSHAVGGIGIDTTMLADGVHTIFWVVTDNGGNTDGIGSRFFTVANASSCGG